MQTSSKIFVHYDLISLAARLKTIQAKVRLKDDTYEKQPEHMHLLYNVNGCPLMLAVTFGIGNCSLSIYFMYTLSVV